MRRSMVALLTLVLVLGFGGTALADESNPFGDVPANYWAYNAVAQLAKDGIVDNYNERAFNGNKTITRYEMAQFVARALNRKDKANVEDKALIERLTAEYSKELTSMNVRIDKLKQEVDKFSYVGILLVKYEKHSHAGVPADMTTYDKWKEKMQLFARYKINDDWAINTTSEYSRNFQKSAAGGIGAGNDDVTKNISVSGKLGVVDVTGGRFHIEDPCSAYVFCDDVTGAQASIGIGPEGPKGPPGAPPAPGGGKPMTITLVDGYIDAGINFHSFITDTLFNNADSGTKGIGYKALYANYTINQFTKASYAYHGLHNSTTGNSKNWNEIGFNTQVAKDVFFQSAAVRTNYATQNNGYLVGLRYGTTIPFVNGSHDIYVMYARSESNANISCTYDTEDCEHGWQGVELGYRFVPMQGLMVGVRYQAAKGTADNWNDHNFQFIATYVFF
ncbi:MAG: S-layer y domain protein [Firmicutes bacterium]|nr:S-layer y domain protein [Bacillota bacterium]